MKMAQHNFEYNVKKYSKEMWTMNFSLSITQLQCLKQNLAIKIYLVVLAIKVLNIEVVYNFERNERPAITEILNEKLNF